MNRLIHRPIYLLFFVLIMTYASKAQVNISPCKAEWLSAGGNISGRTPGLIVKSVNYPTCTGIEENPLWYKFIPKGNSLSLTIKAQNCQSSGEKAITATVFKQRSPSCADLSPLIGSCIAIPEAEEKSMPINLIGGRNYFLQIDGIDTSRCDFTVTYNSNELDNAKGTVQFFSYWDKNGNCTLDNAEKSLPFVENFILLKQGQNVVYTIKPGTQGTSIQNVNFGTYDVELKLNTNLWQSCSLGKITIDQPNQQLDFNIPIKDISSCSRIETDLSAIGVERGKVSAYRLNYKNVGTTVATNAKARVVLDNLQNIVSASKPFSVQNNIVVFQLGDVNPLSAAYIDIQVQNSLELIEQRSVINKADVLPNPICETISGSWNQSEISVYGVCKNDSVYFSVKNSGLAISETKAGIIIEDDFLGRNIKVNPIQPFPSILDSLVVATVPANGKTWRFELPQAPFYPRRSAPSVTIEGCRKGNTGGISVGYANMYPQDDDDASVDVDIRETELAPDYNDMLGFPKGYGAAHYINANQDLEFLIRYKNNSVDPVQRLFIVDTIPLGLDVTTLRLGNSSFPLDWSISENRVLVIALTNINAGDSVYVKYAISQELDLAQGTVLAHRPVFYKETEDAPFVGKTVFHTIGKNFILVSAVETFDEKLKLSVYPNPASNMAHIVLENAALNIYQLEVYDQLSRVIKTYTSQNNQFDIEVGDMEKGLYYFSIKDKSRVVANGKLSVN
ncbi:MAG: DUF7619 domain-containing protein [Saprospiraceae bacterium]